MLAPQFENIPTELRPVPRYVLWKAVGKPGEKPAKVPFCPADPQRHASVTDPQTWGSFEQARDAYLRGGFAGIGLVLNGDGLVGIDIDHCVTDGRIDPAATELLDSLDVGYREISPSGTGLRAFGGSTGIDKGVRGKVNGLNVELYSNERYLTLTGHRVKPGGITHLPRFTELAEFIGAGRKVTNTASDAGCIPPAERQVKLTQQILAGEALHDSLRDLAASLIATGMHEGAVVNHLRGLMLASVGPHDDRWNARFAEIPRLVTSAKAKFPGGARVSDVWRDFARKLQAGSVARGQLPEPFNARLYDPIQEAPRAEPLPRGYSASCDDDWPVPAQLPDTLPAVQPFDPELLPVALRSWIVDIAHRMQCPPDFPAVAAVTALSSLIGARVVIQPKARDDWQVVPNLWGVCVGRPGVKKSPAVSEALKPLHRLQAAEDERWRLLQKEWELDAKVAELAKDGREKKAKGLASKDPAQARALLQSDDHGEAAPVQRRFIVNDATVEKLGELLAVNPWGTLAFRDELYGLLTGLDKQGQEGARAFYLQGYDGSGGYTFDRIGRGTVHIPRVCLGLVGSIQPSRIQEYVRGAVSGGSGDDGLLQRFGLAVWPDTDADYVHVDQWPDTPARQQAWTVFERLAQLQPGHDENSVVYRFSPDAQAIFADWLTDFENELRRDDMHPALVSHLAKYRKLIPALALIFALIDTPESGAVVGAQELTRALAWGKYLRSHAQRLYAAVVVPESAGARTLLAKITAGKLVDADGVLMDAFTPRQVAQKCWTGLGKSEEVRKAAELLVDWDYLRAEPVPSSAGGGRPSERYRVNPRVFAEDSP